MMYAYVVRWNGAIPGREQLAVEYGLEVTEFWGKLAADGQCTEPEMFFFPDGHGMWMVKGQFETLQQLWMTDEAQRLLVKGRYLLQDFGYELVRTGDAVDQYMILFAEVGKELVLS